MAKTGKARFVKAAKRLEKLVGDKDFIPEEDRERVKSALWETMVAAVQARLDAVGGEVFSNKWGLALVTDGRACVFTFSAALEDYARSGFPLPDGAEGGGLFVFAVFVEDEAFNVLPHLARALSVFQGAYVMGVCKKGEFVQIDAAPLIRRLLRRIAKAGGAERFLKAEGVRDVDVFRSLKQLWRDHCEGRVVL